MPPLESKPTGAISITWADDWKVTDAKIKSYEKCPRRFFYTHVLGLGGARKPTAFSRTHDCIYQLIRWLSDARLTGSPSIQDAEVAFEAIWKASGPSDHAFAPDYRSLASRLIAALVDSGAGRRFREAEPLAIDFPNGKIFVEPDEMADLPDGTVVIRRVRTGHKRDLEYDQIEYTLYMLAAQSQFGGRAVVHALHLTDGTAEPVDVTARKMGARKEKSGGILSRIAAGDYPPDQDTITCPRCPHFFSCSATPLGPLKLG